MFVHGFAGSAQQYESQDMRFVANGYPQERILAYDHDGAGLDIEGYADGVDAVVDGALARFGVDQVYLVGHSRGTSVSDAYLGDPARAAKVAKYVAIDGWPCPDVVPCLAPTQADVPGQAHVEVATSAESFAMQYEFLVGEEPEVVEIVPQRDRDLRTGCQPPGEHRPRRDDPRHLGDRPRDRVPHSERTPRIVRPRSRRGVRAARGRLGGGYEYVLTSCRHPGPAPPVPPALRAEQPSRARRPRDQHAKRERRRAPVNAVVELVGAGAIGLHVHDDEATPGQTTLAPWPYFADQPFQSGINVFMPAADAPDGTITVTNIRGDADRRQTLNVPNWSSRGHSISVVFTGHPVD